MRSLALLLLIWSISSVLSAVDIPPESIERNLTIIIEHALSPSKFQPRSNVQLITKSDGKQGLLIPASNGINTESMPAFKRLLESDDLYTIRIRSAASDAQRIPAVVASIPACELQRAGFKEDLTLHLDPNGHIMGASYSCPARPMNTLRTCDVRKVTENSLKFQTKVRLGDSTAAQVVPLQASGLRPAGLADVKLGLEEETRAQPQQQSFLRRYWYIVVAMLIYMVIGGGAPPPAEKSGEGATATAPAAKKRD